MQRDVTYGSILMKPGYIVKSFCAAAHGYLRAARAAIH